MVRTDEQEEHATNMTVLQPDLMEDTFKATGRINRYYYHQIKIFVKTLCCIRYSYDQDEDLSNYSTPSLLDSEELIGRPSDLC